MEKKHYIDPLTVKLDPRNCKYETAFQALKAKLAESTLSAIVLNSCKDRGANASYSKMYQVNMVFIDGDYCEYFADTDMLHFKTDKGFYFFIHECMHFCHLTLDQGKFTMPAMIGTPRMQFSDAKDFKKRTNAERESGYRTIMFCAAYKLDVDFAKIDNLRNMLFYRENAYEWLNVPELAYRVVERVYKDIKWSATMNVDAIDIALTAEEEAYYNEHKEKDND